MRLILLKISLVIFLFGFGKIAFSQNSIEIAKNSLQSFVVLYAYNDNSEAVSLSSGFIVDDNKIITNFHCIQDGVTIFARDNTGKKHEITQYYAVDLTNDLIVLHANTLKKPSLKLSDNSIKVGEKIYVVGNPEGYQGTFSDGLVSGFRKSGDMNVLQITAAISNGSSGGPVLNEDGEVVGVAFASNKTGQSLNFAIPASTVSRLLKQRNKLKYIADFVKEQHLECTTDELISIGSNNSEKSITVGNSNSITEDKTSVITNPPPTSEQINNNNTRTNSQNKESLKDSNNYMVVVFNSKTKLNKKDVRSEYGIKYPITEFKEGEWYYYSIMGFNSYKEAMTYVNSQDIFGLYVKPYNANKSFDIPSEKEQTIADKSNTSNEKDSIAKTRIDNSDKIDKRIKEYISLAEKELRNNNINQAKLYYKLALSLDDKLPYVKKQLKSIEKLEVAENKKQEDYKLKIDLGNKAYGDENYKDAKIYYEEALAIYPESTYPKDMLIEVTRAIQNKLIIDGKVQELWNSAKIAEEKQDYFTARSYYERALIIAPNNQHSAEKIKTLNEVISRNEVNDQLYKKNIMYADLAFKDNKFIKARKHYVQAQNLKPGEIYPKQQLTLIDAKEKELADKKQIFDRYINDGNKAYSNQQYVQAIKLYEKALAVSYNNSYATTKIDLARAAIAQKDNNQIEYNRIIKDADIAVLYKDYSKALDLYKQALALNINNQYPTVKISYIEEIIESNEKKDLEYDTYLKQADLAFNLNKLDEAEENYKLALTVKPNELYPQEKLNKLTALKEKEFQNKKDFSAEYTIAKKAYENKDYLKARIHFNKALTYNPSNIDILNRLKEIESIITSKQDTETKYKNFIADADKAVYKKDYYLAKANYEKALEVKPNMAYPQERLMDLSLKIAEQENRENSYNKTIQLADNSFDQKDYNKAIIFYKKALIIKPDQEYPKTKISTAFELQNKQNILDEDYHDNLSKADLAFESSDYSRAKIYYKRASDIKPGEKYPYDRIREINTLLNTEKAFEDEYSEYITKADNAFSIEDFENATIYYEKALRMKPNQIYIQNQLDQIEIRKREIQSIEETFAALIKKGDIALGIKDYSKALLAYNEALSIKPNEVFVKELIVNIENLILANKENTEREFQQALNNGNEYFELGLYDEARKYYFSALKIKPNNEYLIYKIKETDDAIYEAQEIKNKYDELINKADLAYTNKEFSLSQIYYKKASNLMPEETYPIDQIYQVEQSITKINETETQYHQNISEGDIAFKLEYYDKARMYYKNAIKLKPAEQYPVNRLNEIDNITMGIEKVNKDYEQAILNGNVSLRYKDYEKAKVHFQAARDIKPHEALPLEMLEVIHKSMLLKTKNDEIEFNNLMTKGEFHYNNNELKDAKDVLYKALEIKPDNPVVKSMIADINNKLMQEQKLNNEYDHFLNLAHASFKYQEYDKAKIYYESAHNLKPEKELPIARLSEIDSLASQYEKETALYAESIQLGDKVLLYNDFSKAKTYYKKALDLRAEDEVAANKIKTIEFMEEIMDEIDEVTDEKSQNLELALEEKVKEKEYVENKQYNETLKSADDAYYSKNYGEARNYYVESIIVDSKSNYPKEQIKEINESGTVDKKQYKRNIELGKYAYRSGKLKDARNYYKSALIASPFDKQALKEVRKVDSELEVERNQELHYEKLLDQLVKEKYDLPIDVEELYLTEMQILQSLFIKELNELRASNTKENLTLNKYLTAAAYHQSENMAIWEELYTIDKGKFRTTEDRVKYYGGDFKAEEVVFRIPFKNRGRNISYGLLILNSMEKLMKNEEFMKVILNGDFKYIGIGVSLDEFRQNSYLSFVFGE